MCIAPPWAHRARIVSALSLLPPIIRAAHFGIAVLIFERDALGRIPPTAKSKNGERPKDYAAAERQSQAVQLLDRLDLPAK